MASLANAASQNAPTDVLLSGHIETHITYPNKALVEQQVAQLVAFMNSKSIDTSNYTFIDVSPHGRMSERVEQGKKNEVIAKEILKLYGIKITDVDAKSDMYKKIDFIADGPFGTLRVQFKHRNVNKNSRHNDLGVEYCKIKSGRRGLYAELGRDRSSIADVYISVDSVKRAFHWIPTHLIEDAARAIHSKYTIRVMQQLQVSFNAYSGQRRQKPYFEISKINNESQAVESQSRNSAVISDSNIGQIRYFKSKRTNEGIFKSVFYLNETFMHDWTHVLSGSGNNTSSVA